MNTRTRTIIIIVTVIAAALVWVAWVHRSPTQPVITTTISPAATSTIQYINSAYGFSVDLPQSWKGYSIVNSTWQGDPINGNAVTIATTGPMISIRNPAWTSAKPYQDIPIMVFTLDQWTRLKDEQFHIGAAPIDPGELGRNSKYVLALPARYNFAYPAGTEEVQQIIQNKPLHTFTPTVTR
jgi:hypothetical protein